MNFSAGIQSRKRKRRLGKKKQKHLPRNDTEKHGIRQKQKHGKEEEEKIGFLVFLCALCVFAVRMFLCLRMA